MLMCLWVITSIASYRQRMATCPVFCATWRALHRNEFSHRYLTALKAGAPGWLWFMNMPPTHTRAIKTANYGRMIIISKKPLAGSLYCRRWIISIIILWKLAGYGAGALAVRKRGRLCCSAAGRIYKSDFIGFTLALGCTIVWRRPELPRTDQPASQQAHCWQQPELLWTYVSKNSEVFDKNSI